MPHFPKTEHETRTCPRRHLRNNPDLVPLFALRRACEGQLGIGGARALTVAAVAGLDVLDDAVAFRIKADDDERARRAAVAAAKKAATNVR